jgi:cell division septation protein DedD
MSTAQQERAAAAAMDSLSAASAPKTAAATSSQAAGATSAAAPEEVASAPTKVQTAVVAAAGSAVTAAAPSKPVVKPVTQPVTKPKSVPTKPAQHKPAVHARAEPARVAAKPRRVGSVGVCRTAGWYVQVGAFGKPQSIDRLASKLHRAGYTQVCVAAQQVRGLHLFYVGPYKNAAAARNAKAPLHKLTGAEGILRKRG